MTFYDEIFMRSLFTVTRNYPLCMCFLAVILLTTPWSQVGECGYKIAHIQLGFTLLITSLALRLYTALELKNTGTLT